MEVTPLNINLPAIRNTALASSFEIEPREFKRWLSESTPDRRIRIDTPALREQPAASKSIYGICRPIETVFAAKQGSRSAPSNERSASNLADKQLRLVRLLEKQQEWYDAREEARVRAEDYLDLIEQHQKQWLNHRPSTPPEIS